MRIVGKSGQRTSAPESVDFMDNIILQTLKGEKTSRVPVAPFINVNYVDEFFWKA